MNRPHGHVGYASGASAYASVGVESGVMSADPHQLIELLFDGLDAALRHARIHAEDGNMAAKGRYISRAIDIINQGLLAALDRDSGGELASNLAGIYEYSTRRLLLANLHNDVAGIEEVSALMADIGAAWRSIGAVSAEPAA